MLFDARTVRSGEWDVVRVVGDVDLSTMPALRTQMDRGAGPNVVLDLGEVDVFDPLVFGVVIAGALRASRRGGRFAVVCAQGRTRELFAESGVDRIVAVVETFGDLPAPVR